MRRTLAILALVLLLLLASVAPAQQPTPREAFGQVMREPSRQTFAHSPLAPPDLERQLRTIVTEPSRPNVRWLIVSESAWIAGSAADIHHTTAGIAEGLFFEGNPVLATETRDLRQGRAWLITAAVAGGAALLWRRYPRWANGILFVGGAVRACAGAFAANERFRRRPAVGR